MADRKTNKQLEIEREEKRKSDRRKRKIIVAFILMVFVGLIFTATTYAWFTADKVVTIDMVDVHAQTAAGLTISSDAIDWKASLSNEDLFNANLTYPGATNQIPQETGVIEPCSTVGNIKGDGRLDMFYGHISANLDGTMSLKAFETPEEEHTTDDGKFVAFDIFLKTSTDTPIYLRSDSSVQVKEGTEPKGTENAIRVAFVNEGYVPELDNSSGAQRLNAGNDVKIWEPNNNAHNDYSIEAARTGYGVNLSPTTVVGSYYGVHSKITELDHVDITSTDSRYFSIVTPDFTSGTAGLTGNQPLGMFYRGITKIRVYLWLEGQDYDCEDNSSGGSLQFNLSFTLNERD